MQKVVRAQDSHRSRWPRALRPLLMGLFVLCLVGGFGRAGQAHGGVVIDTGFTDHYEWLVSIDPYPTLLGEAMVTLLVYDIATYEPMNEMTVNAYLAPPDSTTPCCEADVHRGPVSLVIDPELYPGDYSNPVTLDQAGEWKLQFVATVADDAPQNFAVVVPLTVHGSMSGEAPIAIGAESTPDIDATATVFAANVAAARQSSSPLSAPASPLTTPVNTEPTGNSGAFAVATPVNSGPNWWLWGGLGLIPIVLIGWLVLRTPGQDDS